MEEFCQKVKHEVVDFLSRLNLTDGYKFSPSSTLPVPFLASSVFATKILYMLDELPDSSHITELANDIINYQKQDGAIYDDWVRRKSRLKRWYGSIRSHDFNNFLNKQTKRAESRQSFASLLCLGRPPAIPYKNIPASINNIEKYIDRLNWRMPWGAASHISHLIFFLTANKKLFPTYYPRNDDLIKYALDKIENDYRNNNGSWGFGHELTVQQKINGSMKMMTAFDAAGVEDFGQSEKLIDLCLDAVNDEHACDHFNVICVLHHCNKLTDYRKTELKDYALQRLNIYKSFYWHEYGGFSFFPEHCQTNYYGATISCRYPEPDLHGTVMLLWGIVLITDIVGWREQLGLKYPIT